MSSKKTTKFALNKYTLSVANWCANQFDLEKFYIPDKNIEFKIELIYETNDLYKKVIVYMQNNP